MITGVSQATPGVISGQVVFSLGGGLNVTVNGNQTFQNITVYNSSSTPADTFEVKVNNVTQRFITTNSILLCSDNCSDISAPNTSLATDPKITFSWSETNLDDPYSYQLARDVAFVSAFFSGSIGGSPYFTTSQVTLAYNTSYWWRIKNASSAYATSRIWEFITPTAPATLPGFLNISVFDELNQSEVPFINVTLVSFATNTSVNLSSVGTTNYVNFSSSIIAGQEYLAQVSAVGYTTRNILILSPGNYSVFLPYTTTPAGVSQVTFSESDYTGLFPFLSTKLIIQKVINNTITNISSNFFNAVGTSTTQLINGEQYQIVVESPSSTRSLGSYIPTASTTHTLLIATFTLQPGTSYNGLNYSIQYNTNQSIVLQWSDSSGSELISLNETITDDQGNLDYQLITTVDSGQATWLIPNTSAKYLVQLNISTVHNRNLIVRNWYNAATFSITKSGNNYIVTWNAPQWFKTLVAMCFLFIMALLFNRNNATRGMIVVSLFAAIFWLIGWLSFPGVGYAATGAVVGVCVFISIVSVLSESNKGGV